MLNSFKARSVDTDFFRCVFSETIICIWGCDLFL
uniref:Bm14163 n=1 Tax=Brugia malayi TaxID=6279 RepID=A0A1I9G7G1_BRUMA|nr:Bm14163 [Brugia malayi]